MRIVISTAVLVFVFLFFHSCSFEKRVYRNGFYIHHKTYSGIQPEKVKTEEKPGLSLTEERKDKTLNDTSGTSLAPEEINLLVGENLSHEILPMNKENKDANDSLHSSFKKTSPEITNNLFVPIESVYDEIPANDEKKKDQGFYSKLARISFYLLLSSILMFGIALLISAIGGAGGVWVLIYMLTMLALYLAGFITSIVATGNLDKSDPNRKFAVLTLVISSLILITLGILLVLALMFII